MEERRTKGDSGLHRLVRVSIGLSSSPSEQYPLDAQAPGPFYPSQLLVACKRKERPEKLIRIYSVNPKNILLITPTSPHDAGTTKWLSANLGIERLAGFLNARGHHAETYDTNLFKASRSGLSLHEILASKKWDIIGFSLMEETLVEDIANMRLAHNLLPDSLIVAGGHAAQFDYQTILDKSPARIVVMGEGEIPLLRLANGDPIQEIPGVVMKNHACSLTPEEFVDATLSIDYENIPYEKYWDYYISAYQSSGVPITPELSKTIHTIRIFTRNYCPMRCSFCSSTNYLSFATGKKAVPMADITGRDLVSLIRRIVRAHPRVETIYFTDDNFCCKRDDFREFCRLIAEERPPVSFIAFARIDDLDEDMVSWMKRAGFRTLNIGIESMQLEILKEYRKSYHPDVIERNLELLHAQGIRPATTFILCSPEAKLEWVENTIRKILVLIEGDYISPGVNVCVQPQRGSRFFEEYAEFETQIIPIPETALVLHRNHFIKCTDPEVHEFQYRFLHRWAHLIDDEARKTCGHLNSQVQSLMKLNVALRVVEEIKSERGKANCFTYSQMSRNERDSLWKTLQKYCYGASL
jgi:radical SAM superfamily enzyme YgiQ (UPF0313 family)